MKGDDHCPQQVRLTKVIVIKHAYRETSGGFFCLAELNQFIVGWIGHIFFDTGAFLLTGKINFYVGVTFTVRIGGHNPSARNDVDAQCICLRGRRGLVDMSGVTRGGGSAGVGSVGFVVVKKGVKQGCIGRMPLQCQEKWIGVVVVVKVVGG